eukprot:gnl/TRDRNA2_/TRDRNA2_90033_c0_seq1.p1 gnl/TRDRNA2_/TRDRNA2_90033_c0~~gnl/TRDRNA2_/TRDRNA2_90033_c0_seq1.p1  ORF type:complete len:153 (+),score=25.48 gnl/TRDRNA2_/TRDRNA2_90033_c0_seq1:46-504(+)
MEGRSTLDIVRMSLLSFVIFVLVANYGVAIFCKPSRFCGDLSLADPEADPVEVWQATPATAKYVALQSGGWAMCMCIVMGSMMVFQPGCEKALCKSFSLIMVFWQFVWYGAMLNKIDALDTYKRSFMAFFKKETIQEIVFFLVFGYLGFIAA